MILGFILFLTLQSTPAGQSCHDIHFAMNNYARCESACTREDDGAACHRLASLQRDGYRDESGAAHAASYETAMALFQRSCELGYGFGCHDVGLIHWQGPPEFRNDRAAVDRFDQACDEHALDASCGMLGNAYYLGRGIEADLNQAVALWEASCSPQRTALPACRQLGTVHVHEEIPAARPQFGLETLEEACGNGDSLSCVIAARALLMGVTVPENIPRSIALTDQACELGLPPSMAQTCSPAFRTALERMAEMSPNQPGNRQ